MHLLTGQKAGIEEAGEAVDLDIPPGDIVILSAADTELTVLSRVHGRSDGAASLRLANLMALSHPFSVDLFVEKTLAGARLVIVRILGGRSYWSYGLERLVAHARAAGIPLIALSGDTQWDEDLFAVTTVGEAAARAAFGYFSEGGERNMALLLDLARDLATGGPAPEAGYPRPRPVAKAGYYRPGGEVDSLDDLRASWPEPDRPAAAIVFYRSALLGAATAPVDMLITALEARGLNPLPVFVTSLKDADSAEFLEALFDSVAPDIVLNATAFAVSRAGGVHEPTPLDRPGRTVLQVVFSGGDEEVWREGSRGLSPSDLAMHVVLPELDGRVATRAVSFKALGEIDPRTGYRPTAYSPVMDRIEHVADLAARHVRLGRKPANERRVAMVLANYPNRDGRIGNGVGLDTPESAARFLTAMAAAGYGVDDHPETGRELMDRLLGGVTNATGTNTGKTASLIFPCDRYEEILASYDENLRARINERWGRPEDDPFVSDGAFRLPAHRFGNVVVGIQPARGYNLDPKETYHDPDLLPPHNYLAFYFWLRHGFDADAVVHFGKHGNLEWLPGKALALSGECWPEVALGPLPNLYPFIVNDPGEGSQAKRRISSVIVDHLTPPMTRAEAHGPALELEALIDEYYLASGVDRDRLDHLATEILDLAARHGFDRDVGVETGGDRQTALARIDAHLCDLKELQIREGLHVFGRSPEGRELTDLLAAIARIPRGKGPADASILRALAGDLGLDGFDPLDCDFAAPHGGERPAILAEQGDAPWRSLGDTVERLEILASKLIAGMRTLPAKWTATAPVLEQVRGPFAAAIRASGPAETSALLAGLDNRFVAPGPSGAPTRARPDVLPTGRNFYSVDVRAVPTKTAWRLGKLSADRLAEFHFQEEGEWPKSIALSAWGTSNMRTGGDDIAQALALIGVEPCWDDFGARVIGFEIVPLSDLGRPRIDVTLRISGFFRDAFPHQIELFEAAVRAVARLDEPDDANPIAADVRARRAAFVASGANEEEADRRAAYRVFGSMPGAYGAGLQALIDETLWTTRADFAASFVEWGGYAYGKGAEGAVEKDLFRARLSEVEAVVHNQDNREHDLLDSDDYYQFQGGLAASVETFRGQAPAVYHTDHSRPERPVVRRLEQEIGRVVRGRAANPKWIAGAMRHGYKGAFEMAATLDYLFAYAATTNAVADHHFDQLFDAYIADDEVRAFLERENPNALDEMTARFREAIERGLWAPRRNSTFDFLGSLTESEPALEERP